MRILLGALLVPFATLRAGVQQQTIDLTGKPAASIPEPFTKISGVQELSGALAVATDNMEAKVLLLDFARGTVEQIGSKGDGPNEYRYPSRPIAAPGGAYVFDTYMRRAFMIGRDGKISAMKTLPEGPLARVRSADGAGRVYFEGSDFDPNTGGFSDSLPVVRWDPNTNRVDRVARVYGGGRVIIQRGRGKASLAREITPFPHLDAWTALPDGRLALLRHEPFRIDFVSTTGATTAGQPIPTTPIPVTARERDWYRKVNTPPRMRAAMVGGGTGPQSMTPQWEDTSFPQTMPTFIGDDVLSTPEGQIWIPRSFTSTDKVRKYEIYDSAGTLTGTAIVDAHSRIVGFGPKSVYVARTNPDDDLVYLSKYAR
jgi:hypothetical protein